MSDNDAEIEQLKKFYNVESLEALVLIQAQHIERLQAKLPPSTEHIRTHVREG